MDGSKKSIFLIDDDKYLLDMYALKFSKAGYAVDSADSTDVALKKIQDGYCPDVMLVDIVMPGMDGLELISTLKKEKLAPRAVMIVLSNQGGPDDIGRAQKVGVDGYIVKATTIPSEVLTQVEKICASKKS